MKDLFFEYYPTPEDQINEIWETCLFSYDTNILLNFYRYTDKTRNKFIEVIDKLKDRSILTNHAAIEFHRNRLVTIAGQTKAYDSLCEFLNDKFKQIENELNQHKKHTYIQSANIKDQFNKTFKRVKKDILKLKTEHPDLYKSDPIRDRITELFSGKVSSHYDETRLSDIYKKGKNRYEKKVPPGYEDFKEKKDHDESSLYGDLIIWNQIMDLSKEQSLPIVFVTDDLKDDWWYRFNGKTISPRPELLKEFKLTTNQQILIYNADTFLNIAGTYTKIDVNEEVAKEVEELKERDLSIVNSSRLNESYAKLFETARNQAEMFKMFQESASLVKSFEEFRTQGTLLNSLRERYENDKKMYGRLSNPFLDITINRDEVYKVLGLNSDQSERSSDEKDEA